MRHRRGMRVARSDPVGGECRARSNRRHRQRRHHREERARGRLLAVREQLRQSGTTPPACRGARKAGARAPDTHPASAPACTRFPGYASMTRDSTQRCFASRSGTAHVARVPGRPRARRLRFRDLPRRDPGGNHDLGGAKAAGREPGGITQRDIDDYLSTMESQGAEANRHRYRLGHILIAVPDGASSETIDEPANAPGGSSPTSEPGRTSQAWR